MPKPSRFRESAFMRTEGQYTGAMNDEEKALLRQKIAGHREAERLHLQELRRETPEQKLDAVFALMALRDLWGPAPPPLDHLTEEQERWATLKRAYLADPSILRNRRRA